MPLCHCKLCNSKVTLGSRQIRNHLAKRRKDVVLRSNLFFAYLLQETKEDSKSHPGGAGEPMDLRDDSADHSGAEVDVKVEEVPAKEIKVEAAAGENAHRPLYTGSNFTVAQFSLLAVDHQVFVQCFSYSHRVSCRCDMGSMRLPLMSGCH